MKYTPFESYGNQTEIINEEIDAGIQSILNHDNINSKFKHNMMTQVVRSLIKQGKDTGLEDSKPKRGSSRVVYFPKDEHKMVLDGQETSMPTALKIAYPGRLDAYNKSGKLLGEHQNEVENDHFNRSMAVIVPHPHRTNEYVTNPHGVLAPVVDNQSDHHWSLHGRVSKIGAGDFRNLTKTDRFPNGISHREFYDAMMLHHHDAHGIGGAPGAYTSEERSREVQNHPFVENATDAMFYMGMHPADLNKGNMGVWEHPVTKKKQLVISDYGYSHNVSEVYNKCRKEAASYRNYT